SRLSYLALGSMPDNDLFAAAADGSLSTQAGLRAQMERLLALDQAKFKARQFFNQWLRLSPAPTMNYPASFLSDIKSPSGLRQAMERDLADYIDYVLWAAK